MNFEFGLIIYPLISAFLPIYGSAIFLNTTPTTTPLPAITKIPSPDTHYYYFYVISPFNCVLVSPPQRAPPLSLSLVNDDDDDENPSQKKVGFRSRSPPPLPFFPPLLSLIRSRSLPLQILNRSYSST